MDWITAITKKHKTHGHIIHQLYNTLHYNLPSAKITLFHESIHLLFTMLICKILLQFFPRNNVGF